MKVGELIERLSLEHSDAEVDIYDDEMGDRPIGDITNRGHRFVVLVPEGSQAH